MVVKKSVKVLSTLNLAVIMISLAFIIGTYSIIFDMPYSEGGFFSRINTVMTGAAITPAPELSVSSETCTKPDGLGGTISVEMYCPCKIHEGNCYTGCSDSKTLKLTFSGYCENSCLGGCPGRSVCGSSFQNPTATKYCGDDYNDATKFCNSDDPYHTKVTHHIRSCSSGACIDTPSTINSDTCSASQICVNGACATPTARQTPVVEFIDESVFVGTTDTAITLNQDPTFNLRTLTISAWIKTTQSSGTILSKKSASSGYELKLESGKIKGILTFDSSTSNSIVSSQSVNDGLWHNIAMTYDGVNVIIFLDGRALKSQPYTGGISFNSEKIYIGLGYVGSISRLILYDHALSLADASAFYENMPLPNCRDIGGELNNTNLYKCIDNNNNFVYVSSYDSTSVLKCCDLRVAKWYESFSTNIEVCPTTSLGGQTKSIGGTNYCIKGSKVTKALIELKLNERCYNLTKDSVEIIDNGKRYCDPTQGMVYEEFNPTTELCIGPYNEELNISSYCLGNTKTTKTSTLSCEGQGGKYYDKKVQNCASADLINIPEYDCCKNPTWKTCEDPARIPAGDLCDLTQGFICTGQASYSSDSIAGQKQCCSQTCTYTGQWKTCSEMNYNICNITKGETCRDGNVVASKDSDNNLVCCGVSCNTTVVEKTCSEQIKELCDYDLGLKCPIGSLISSLSDVKDSKQCCGTQCQLKKCSELSPYYTLCDLSSYKCQSGDSVRSSDSIPGQVQCCKATCEPIIAAPSASCGNGKLDSGEECDGNNIAGQTCLSKGYLVGTLKCANNCKFDFSGCQGAGAPALPSGPAGVCDNLPLGARDNGKYCAADGSMLDIKTAGATCLNNFECTSNFCQDGTCTSLKSTLDLIPRIWCLLSAWIANPADSSSRTLSACDCMCGFFNNDNKHLYLIQDCGKNYDCPTI